LSQINWDSPLSKLTGKKSKTAQVLENNGFLFVKDVLNIFPLRTEVLPVHKTFNEARTDQLFRGLGKVLHVQEKPNMRIQGKRGMRLFNVTVLVKDHYSHHTIQLKWFNLYPSPLTKIKSYKDLSFLGHVTEFMGQKQITNPDVKEILESEIKANINDYEEEINSENAIRVTYPTVSGISPHHLKKVFEKIPLELWQQIDDFYPEKIIEERGLLTLTKTYQYIHGKCSKDALTDSHLTKSHERILYNELINNQLKVAVRKNKIKQESSIRIKINPLFLQENKNLFPYELTADQKQSCLDIFKDFYKDYPMMRLIQGDVGCGKTSVALLTAFAVVKEGYQCAIMCPTETLAMQHYRTFSEILNGQCRVSYLTGALKKKEKDGRLEDLKNGKIDIIIGTHALIQRDVAFKNLAFAIIDEQHKFGVNQRISLVTKGEGVHCALMTATPIPRSLRLTQYGDLEMSLIKVMPSGRKGTQTKIVFQDTYQKYLSFIQTRVEMGEQVYIVVPAVVENEDQDILNLEFVLKKYREYYPQFSIEGLHGQMKNELKNQAIQSFMNGETQILISTSVIEVGINNPQATIMAILNPDRFGLSSLHQMRGRVGRGEKPGFCFLVNDKKVSATAMERQKVIEQNTDGFVIADEDLRIRGEGDLFGKEQSGSKIEHLNVNIFDNPDLLIWANEDALKIQKDYPQVFLSFVEQISADDKVTKTI